MINQSNWKPSSIQLLRRLLSKSGKKTEVKEKRATSFWNLNLNWKIGTIFSFWKQNRISSHYLMHRSKKGRHLNNSAKYLVNFSKQTKENDCWRNVVPQPSCENSKSNFPKKWEDIISRLLTCMHNLFSRLYF